MSPRVSVIVPNYMHAAFLPQRLESILGQTFTDLEVILLDDASTDGSADVLHRYATDPRVTHVVINERNSGSPFTQWRKGLALARGEWIWFAESDDSCDPRMVQRLLALEQAAAPAPGLLFAQSMFIDERGERIGSMLRHTASFDPDPFQKDFVMDGGTFIARYLAVKNVIPNASAVLVRRELLLDERLWAGIEGMRFCGDWLLWVRLLLRTHVGFVSEELNAFRHHAATTRAPSTKERELARLLEERDVRSTLANVPGVEQRVKEEALYKAWFWSFPLHTVLSPRLYAIRLQGRSRLALMGRFLAFQWARHRKRMAGK